jgi:hypothetical protein
MKYEHLKEMEKWKENNLIVQTRKRKKRKESERE